MYHLDWWTLQIFSQLSSQKYYFVILQHVPVIYDLPSLYGLISIVKQSGKCSKAKELSSLCKPCPR